MSNHVIWDTSSRPRLVLKPEQQMVFRCLHCGEHLVLALPCSIRVVAAVGKAYGAEHRRCKPRKSDAP